MGPPKGAVAPWPESRSFIKPGLHPQADRAKGRRADQKGPRGTPSRGRESPRERAVTPDTDSSERCPGTPRPGEVRAEVTSGKAAPGQPNRRRWMSGHLGTQDSVCRGRGAGAESVM